MVFRLYDDFSDLLTAFNKEGVKYIVVGGYAVIHHGYNRFTGDLDIWVEQSKDNFQILSRAFANFGIPASAIEEVDFLKNEKDVYTFGRPPVCFEILTAVKGLNFAEAYSHSIKVVYDGVEVNMIDLMDLIKAKKAAGRHKDLDDIDHIAG
jgi:predicted nucleotidyltransferase